MGIITINMKNSSIPVLACILLLLPFLCQAHQFDLNESKPKSYEFLQSLQGCRKGDTIKGLNELKKYLKKFGYLNNLNHVDDDAFDNFMEAAIKTYQINYNLKATGILDPETVNKMMMPRCGVPDFVNGTTSMRSGKKKHLLHSVSHYTFLPGPPRWPPSKTNLTYAFLPGTQVDVLSPICARAFGRWSSVSHFTFEEIQDYTTADITISMQRGDHGDAQAFDGPGGILAHAYSPTDGRFHYDGDETWVNGPVEGAYDYGTVTLHEIGHLLGLGHSSVEGAIMYPSILSGVTKDLNGDDVQGIQALYNH